MDKKCIILKREGKILSLVFHGNRLVRAGAEDEGGGILGRIHIARVKDVVNSIHAAFVEIQPGVRCFLSLREVRKPLLLNREYDGRLLAEDELLVQVNKEAIGNKPPSVTCNVSLDGKYCVLSLGKPGISYSAKLSAKARVRIAKGLEDGERGMDKFGIIIRTNARDLQEELAPLREEICRLSGTMEELLRIAPFRTCFSLLYEKPPAYLTGLRDMYAGQYEEILTDDREIFEKINAFSGMHPEFALPPARLYQDVRLPLGRLYGVEKHLQQALGRKVWMRSGGYLIIEPTEALTVIDVNSGKAETGKRGEETYFRINMEAAEEIAVQLALRNISGIIVVDFISMAGEEERRRLMAHFGDLLKRDAVRSRLVDITALGLVEVTRMKISRPLKEQLG